ncbi:MULTISPECIES: VPS10 domain-containing protein [unclassified Cellulophaga]|uniref:VPS10 domain-containing protein n=1 Tax=unclassified Cellulophaga TaxID=2634405 RepID=UPI0026E3922F|nr:MULTISPECIES: T9SS type A sorting domain-containing protein [unclassified Cellulophaga]MDO6491055.1 T9SS type A sorting domain-containing protein [Cellulophaga sp. 2_MG-2023]MDO6493751.1 T9SS type A sorting domain-containing protein [Cellulophaga sp. 3_MG-2023]
MMKKLLFIKLLYAFTFLCINISYAQNTAYFNKLRTEKVISTNSVNWVQFGPGMSGYCEFFWNHPTDKNTILMAPDMFNGYGSFDGGKSWQTIKDYDGEGFDMGRTYDVEFSRQNPNLGFATDELAGLYKTTNKGRSWKKTNFNLGGAHNEIAVDPKNDNIWYIGAGTFWDSKRFHRTANDKTGGTFRPKAILGHIYKSTNKGSTWKKITNGLPAKLAVAKIIVDPTNTNNVIMAANTGLYLSSNKGESWTLAKNNGLPNNLPRDMTSHYNKETNKFTLFLVDQTSFYKTENTFSSKGGIYKSTDGGKSWTSITGDLGINLTKITSNPTKYYYKRSIAKWLGINISDVSNNLPKNILQNYNRIVVNPKNSNQIYVSHNVKHDFSFGPGDIWKTNNGGQTWFPIARTGKYWKNNTDQNYWNSRAVKVSGSNTKFAHIQKNMDEREEIWGCRFMSIDVEGNVFTSLDQQVLKLTNGENKWKQIDDDETFYGSKSWIGKGGSNLPGRYIYLETGIPNRKLFLSGEHGLWKSTGLGRFANSNKVATTQLEGQNNTNGAHSIATLAVHPNNPNIIYTLQFRQKHRDKFRRSKDGGKTWENISTPIDYPDTNLSSQHFYSSSLMIDPVSAKTIYFTLMRYSPSEINEGTPVTNFSKYGVYKSTDGGKSWSLKNNGLPAKSSIRRLEMHPTNSNIIYAASNLYKGVNGGLYRTNNKAQTWTKINTLPSSIKSVNNVHIDKTTKDIYISCGVKGSTNNNSGGVWRSKDNAQTWKKIFDLNYVWQTETSPINPEIIAVTVPRSPQHKNPGIYISKNGGNSWSKANKNLAHAHSITDIKPDNKDENTFWCSGWGSGWYKATWNNTNTLSATSKTTSKDNSLEKDNGFSIFPNPTTDIIKIRSSLNNCDITIFDFNGEIVKSLFLGKNSTKEVSLSGLKKGIYFVQFKPKNETKGFTKKVILK